MSGDYNRVYRFKRLILQITSKRQNKGIVIDVFPQVVIAIANNKIVFGVGFEWIAGTLNFGVMRQSFIDAENKRLAFIAREAKKQNLTPAQYSGRYNP